MSCPGVSRPVTPGPLLERPPSGSLVDRPPWVNADQSEFRIAARPSLRPLHFARMTSKLETPHQSSIDDSVSRVRQDYAYGVPDTGPVGPGPFV